MSIFRSLLEKLADPKDRELLARSPTLTTRLRVLGRVGLKFWWAYLIGLVLLGTATLSMGMDVYHRTETPQFCGACHEMTHNFDTWQASRHKNITCADCHSRPGLTGWVRSKTAGLNQLIVHMTAESITDIKVQEDQRDTINSNCLRCHTALARIGERFGLGVSHRQHLDKGIDCVTCHTGEFTHPPSTKKDEKAGDKGEADEKGEKDEKGDKDEAKEKTEGSDAPVAANKETDDAAHDTTATSSTQAGRFVEVAQCYQCHDGKSRVGDETVFSATDEAHCLKCHPDADQAQAHGARSPKSADRKPCLDCHEVEDKQPHYAMKNPDKICVKCHELEEHESTHTPYSSGECSECHTVMSAAYLFKTGPRPTNAACLECHETLAGILNGTVTDEVGPFSDGTKDLHKEHAEELSKKGNDWCLACHASHWSDSMRGVLKMRQDPEFKRPATFSLTMYQGGSCQGGCHDKPAPYSGPSD